MFKVSDGGSRAGTSVGAAWLAIAVPISEPQLGEKNRDHGRSYVGTMKYLGVLSLVNLVSGLISRLLNAKNRVSGRK